jgi:hypothetical protein
MNKYILIILIFILILIIQKFSGKFLNFNKTQKKQVKKRIQFNISHQEKIQDIFISEIKKRIKLLDNMSYNDWIEYNKKNKIIKFDNYEYYFFIFELIIPTRSFDNSTFINRVHIDNNFINFSWSDIIKTTKDHLVFSRFSADENMLANSYILGKQDNLENNIINYYWYDYTTQYTTKKYSIVKTWFKDNISGIIGIGYNYEIIDDKNGFKVIKYINKPILIFTILSTLIITLLMYYLYSDFKKSVIFLLLSHVYITYFINIREDISSPQTELDKIKNINEGILSISFLAGVSIFILSNLRKNNNKLFTESAIIFTFSIIFLLFTTYKITDYTSVEDILKVRITNQFQFNFAVILNIFIIINYLLHIIESKKTEGKITS